MDRESGIRFFLGCRVLARLDEARDRLANRSANALILLFATCALDRRPLRWHPGFWMLILWLFTLGLGVTFSADPERSIVKFAGSGYLVVLAFLAFNHSTSLKKIRLVIFAWLAGAVIPILTGVVGIITFYLAPDTDWLSAITYHYGAVPVGYFPRVSSTMVSPSMLCNYMTVTLVLVLAAFNLGWLERRVAIASIALILLVSLFTASIVLGGMALAAGLWIWHTGHQNRRFALFAASVVAILFLATAPVSMGDAIQGSIAPSSRLLVWSDAAKTFLSDPIVGTGPGLPVANVLFRNTDGTASLLTDAHNTFLNVAAQAGVAGLLGLLAVVFAVSRAGYASSLGRDDLAVIQRALLVAFVCTFLYDGLTGSFEDARHLWVLIGSIFAVDALYAKPELQRA
jgi:putative inorganic carbon (hco3(-)) transporter